jgi:hypothetical protein
VSGLLDAQPADRPDGSAAPDSVVVVHTPASVWRRLRGPLLILALLALVALVTVLVRGQAREGRLDPVATTPDGARALAVLLEDAGVDVERVTTADAALAGGPGATVVLPLPEALPDGALRRLADSGLDVVALGPAQGSLPTLAPGLEVAGSTGVAVRPPLCDLPAARTAGPVDLGGLTYDTTGTPTATACYDAAGGALLVQVERPGGGTTTVLGDGEPLTNGRLASEGNAALGLLLLGGDEEVRWLVPAPGAQAPEEERSLLELLPASVRTSLVLLAVAAVLAALWRARRLGPVVSEPLPVVVRAAETVEGRARLYRAARARDRAAESLRGAARARLAPVAGAGPEPDARSLVAALADRIGREGAELEALLYGPVPTDDRALVRLASELDALEAQVRAGSAPRGAGADAPSTRRGPA